MSAAAGAARLDLRSGSTRQQCTTERAHTGSASQDCGTTHGAKLALPLMDIYDPGEDKAGIASAPRVYELSAWESVVHGLVCGLTWGSVVPRVTLSTPGSPRLMAR